MSVPALIPINPKIILEPWPDYPLAEIASGTRANNGHFLYENKAEGLSVGVWEQGANETHWMDYPVHEFMIILEGAVTIEERNCETTITAGQSFVIPKGRNCRWKQKDRVRKIFVILDAGVAKSDSHVVKIDTDAKQSHSPPPSADVLLSSPPPTQQALDFYEAHGGRFSVGLWSTTHYRRKLISFPRWELMHILEGQVSMDDGEGHAHEFRAGDTFFVPHGATNAWTSTADLKKIFCILLPKAA